MEWITPKLLNFASLLEQKTRQQAIESSKLDIIWPYLALMPDAHLGKGATVGSVIPTIGAIIPAAVGVDIGCGMMAIRTQWTRHDFADVDLQELHKKISEAIPLSAGRYNGKLAGTGTLARIGELKDRLGIDQANEVTKGSATSRAQSKRGWEYQLGSLGSGNHFIELSYDEEGRVWLFLHSGSRGVGNKIAQKHISIAQEVCTAAVPNRDLKYLTEGTDEFSSYMEGLKWAQHFAYLNREEMMDRVINAVSAAMGERARPAETINCHHNYTERYPTESGENVWLSRKGAIDAALDQPGLIPGSMGTLSYVVTGLGNGEAFDSSPHGAGRPFSRGEARRRFTYEDLAERMQGVAWGESKAFLDEHPEAYKDIDVVMEDSRELVTPVHKLKQFVNVKGN